MKNTKTKFHFPLPILVGEGKLILDAATAHPEVAGRWTKPIWPTPPPCWATSRRRPRPETETRPDRRVEQGATGQDSRLPAFDPQRQGDGEAGLQGPDCDTSRGLSSGRPQAARFAEPAPARSHRAGLIAGGRRTLPALTSQRMDGGREHGAGHGHHEFGERQDAAGSRERRKRRLDRPEERAGG